VAGIPLTGQTGRRSLITLYVKPTNFCNVGCSHCYLPESVRADAGRMGVDVVAAVGAFAAEMAAYGRHAETHVVWHGGEPLTVAPEFYFAAGAVLDRLLPNHTESLQTSLMPFREAHVRLVRERFGSWIGSSVDFSQRRLKGSIEAYLDLWLRKVELARANGLSVVPGVVPTRAEVGREAWIVDWFVARGFPVFNVDRYNAYRANLPDRPTNREHALFLCGLFDALIAATESRGEAPLVGAVAAGIAGVLYGVGGDRWGGSCASDFVVVEPDGSLNNCPDKSTVDESFGDVRDGFKAFAGNRFRRKSVKHQQFGHKKSYCHSCVNAHFCKSGCPITPNGVEEDPSEVECSGYWTFLDHVRRAASDGRRAAMEAYVARTPAAGYVDGYSRAAARAKECAA
jgi:radical SAM protein with 4Fe4S-binding SPASM domain